MFNKGSITITKQPRKFDARENKYHALQPDGNIIVTFNRTFFDEV